jgi:hypothetical protein
MKGKRTFATRPLSLWERKISLPVRMVKMSKRPPESITKTKMARMRVNSNGREEWMFFNPTTGIYQSKKIKKKRMRQEITNSPIKILFLGRLSNATS